jgi:hypothetical protein
MRVVTRDEFFAAIGNLNVHPSPEGPWDQEKDGYRSEWRMQDGSRRLVGVSQGGKYELAE